MQKDNKSSNGVTGCHTVLSDCSVYLVNSFALICVYLGGWTESVSWSSAHFQIPSGPPQAN